MRRRRLDSAQAWDGWYSRHGRRVIATRDWQDEERFAASGERDLRVLLDSFGVPAGVSVHEIGCGPGRLTVQLSHVYDRVTANDVSSLALADCARRVGGGVTLLRGGAATLEQLPGGTYDAVVSIVTLQHVSDRDEVVEYFRQAVRLLGPGGVALLQLARSTPLRSCHDAAVDWCRRLSRMPRGEHWRGCVLQDAEIVGLAAQLGVAISLAHNRWMTWARLQK